MFITQDKKQIDGSYFICPITGKINNKPTLIGTCFFIDHFGGFVTTKHCLNYSDIDPFIVIQRATEQLVHLRKDKMIFKHRTNDICLDKTEEIKVDGKIISTPIIDYEFKYPNIGEKVRTSAYPKSTLIDPTNNIWKFSLDQFFGEIVDIYDNCPSTKLKGHCIQTNINILSGASGGTVFGPNNKVFGINSTSLEEPEDCNCLTSFVTSLNNILEIEVIHGTESILFGELFVKQLSYKI
ncbi:MAG: trypsin-like peptidase domain-containing protein [Saprospiraceae bacterium]|nr:trypsin-like peptidase domain-containing protein [Candidatus Vicinibacter affinis]